MDEKELFVSTPILNRATNADISSIRTILMSPRPYRYMIRTALLCATVLTASPTNADHSIQIAKLLADDGAAGDKFSFWPSAMAISGNTTT